MEVIRVTEEWQRAGVHYVRVQGMCREFGLSLQGEFEADKPEDLYILALDGNLPVSTCRLHFTGKDTGKIERVATIGEYRNKGVGSAVIQEAEKWMKEKGIREIRINSRIAALHFYEKLGYVSEQGTENGFGEFRCINVKKKI